MFLYVKVIDKGRHGLLNTLVFKVCRVIIGEVMEAKLENNSSFSTNKLQSFTAKIFSLISPVSTSHNTTESLKVKISSNGLKLDVDSLLTNDAITEQAKAIKEAL